MIVLNWKVSRKSFPNSCQKFFRKNESTLVARLMIMRDRVVWFTYSLRTSPCKTSILPLFHLSACLFSARYEGPDIYHLLARHSGKGLKYKQMLLDRGQWLRRQFSDRSTPPNRIYGLMTKPDVLSFELFELSKSPVHQRKMRQKLVTCVKVPTFFIRH